MWFRIVGDGVPRREDMGLLPDGMAWRMYLVCLRRLEFLRMKRGDYMCDDPMRRRRASSFTSVMGPNVPCSLVLKLFPRPLGCGRSGGKGQSGVK